MSERRQAGRRGPISSTDAAFAGFALVRERPTLFFGLMVLIVLLGLATSLTQVLIAGPALTQLMEMQAAAASGGERPDPTATLQLMGPIWRANLIILPLIAVSYAVTNAAVYRALLRPAQGGFGYLRFGADELRQLGTLILLGLTMLAVIILSEIALIVVGIVGAVVVAGGLHTGDAGKAPLAVGFAVLLVLLLFVPIVFVAVRLSLAGPMTFAQRRVRLTGSWALTRGRFWAMFGAYLLAGVLIVLAAVVLLVVCCLIAFAVSGIAGVRGLFIPDSRSVASFFTPERIVMMVLNAPVGALWIGTQAAVPAALYAQFAGDPDMTDPGAHRSHAFGSAVASEPVPPPPDTEYPITPPREGPPSAGT